MTEREETVADVLAEWREHARKSGALTQTVLLARLESALKRGYIELTPERREAIRVANNAIMAPEWPLPPGVAAEVAGVLLEMLR